MTYRSSSKRAGAERAFAAAVAAPIERGVPAPASRHDGARPRAPARLAMAEMRPGDSRVFQPPAGKGSPQVKLCQYAAAEWGPGNFRTRRQDGGTYRVWRLR